MRIIVADDDRVARLVAGSVVASLGHEVVLTDWVMPGVDGRELCRRIRTRPRGSYTYIGVVTSLSARAEAMAAMEAGADDYISKPLDPGDLAVRLVVATRVTELHRRLLWKRQELLQLHRTEALAARTDALTGLGNRRCMNDELASLAARDTRYGHRYWLLLCDIDRFKNYNDRYGHLGGDKALGAVATTLRQGLRRADSMFRYGGEEFLAVLTEESLDGARDTAERLRREVEGLRIPHALNPPTSVVTISAGLTALTGPVEEALARADTALYSAKVGRNQIAWLLEHDLTSPPGENGGPARRAPQPARARSEPAPHSPAPAS